MSVRRALAPRSVHLRIVPRPANLSESREIFRVLQQFGEVSTYKYLRYEYQNPADNVALAIFRDDSAAQAALDASPIRFALEKATSIADSTEGPTVNPEDDEATLQDLTNIPPTPGIEEMLRPSKILSHTLSIADTPSKPDPPAPSMPFDPLQSSSTQVQKKWTKWFQITLDRSRAVHQDFIERQPYWKQFNPMRSMAQVDLEKIVPHVGLSDVSKRPPNAHRTPVRVLKGMSEYVEKRMPTLRGIMEDSEGERNFRIRKGIDAKGYRTDHGTRQT